MPRYKGATSTIGKTPTLSVASVVCATPNATTANTNSDVKTAMNQARALMSLIARRRGRFAGVAPYFSGQSSLDRQQFALEHLAQTRDADVAAPKNFLAAIVNRTLTALRHDI